MKQYLIISLICSIIAIWTATFIGCTVHQFYPDCATDAVNRALMAGEPTRIWIGRAPIEFGHTMGHFEAQKLIGGEWYWLRSSGCGVIASKIMPKGFIPYYCFEDTLRFIELQFFTDFEDNSEIEWRMNEKLGGQ